MVVFLMGVFFAETIPVEPSTQTLIRTASLALMFLFLAIFAGMLGRILYMRSRRQEHQSLREDVISLENRLLQKQYEFHDLAARVGKSDSEAQSLHRRIELAQEEIDQRRARIDQPYA
jgi:uncharacterized protein YlxW (UPF0749 family)